MKRLLALLLMMLLGASALAETTVLGYMSDGDYIHQYVAPNGQLLWFTAMEEKPHIKQEDVNFDGAEDIVVFTILGASNFFTEFFLYDAQADMYVLATHPGQEHGICNYGLHPALGWWNPRPTMAARARSMNSASIAGKGRSSSVSAAP